MASYTLDYTGAETNALLHKVHEADFEKIEDLADNINDTVDEINAAAANIQNMYNTLEPIGNISDAVALAAEIVDGASDIVREDDLATVATSGSYEDLSNKPTIPEPVTMPSIVNDIGGSFSRFVSGEITLTNLDNITSRTMSVNVGFKPDLVIIDVVQKAMYSYVMKCYPNMFATTGFGANNGAKIVEFQQYNATNNYFTDNGFSVRISPATITTDNIVYNATELRLYVHKNSYQPITIRYYAMKI